jgi:KaiC/GvpD/RAD55 family RecA-like ATPase
MTQRGVLASALMRGQYGARKTGKTLAFRCPRHRDSHASAWLGDHQWGCSACGFTEHFDTLATALGVTLPEEAVTGRGLSLHEYAERKRLSLQRLAEYGVVERIGRYGDTLIAIPYRDATGAVLRTKMRTRTGTFWDKDGTGTPLYGQDVLARTPQGDPVLLVEGESDCHAGWQAGLCVVGLPGASQWRAEYAALLAKRDVYVWQEPDEGGGTMVSAVAQHLPKAKVIRDVRWDGAPVKDLCDLNVVLPEGTALRQVVQDLMRTAIPIGAEAPAVTFDTLSGDTLTQLLAEKEAPVEAIPTPLAAWDAVCRGAGGGKGLARGWYVTIGANTGTGKSLVALNIAHAAVRHGVVSCFVSLEMARSELATRFLAIVSGEAVISLEQGDQFDREAFTRASRQLDELRAVTGGHLLVNRRPLSRLADVVASMRYYAEVYGARLFLVDYLQLASVSGVGSHINDRIEAVSHAVRDVTTDLRVTTVALSQFNRQTSAERDQRPVSQGLMGGSAIENDSHQVLLLDHSRYVRSGSWGDTWMVVDKNRHGPVTDIAVRWDYRTLRLEPRAMTIEEQEQKHGRLTRHGRMR